MNKLDKPPKDVVWFDPNIKNNENQKYAEKVFPNFHACEAIDEVLEYLKNRTKTCIVLSSGNKGEELFTKIYSDYTNYRRKVMRAAIFCRNKQYHVEWVKKFALITDISDRAEDVMNVMKSLWDEYVGSSNVLSEESQCQSYEPKEGYVIEASEYGKTNNVDPYQEEKSEVSFGKKVDPASKGKNGEYFIPDDDEDGKEDLMSKYKGNAVNYGYDD